MNILVKKDSVNDFARKFLGIDRRDSCSFPNIGNRFVDNDLVKGITSFSVELDGFVGNESKTNRYLVTFEVQEYDGINSILKEVKRELIQND